MLIYVLVFHSQQLIVTINAGHMMAAAAKQLSNWNTASNSDMTSMRSPGSHLNASAILCHFDDSGDQSRKRKFICMGKFQNHGNSEQNPWYVYIYIVSA